MGGRGSRAGGRAGRPLPGGGAGAVGGIGVGAGAPPPKVKPGQPVPAITQQQLQSMNDTEFVNYLNGLRSTPIDPNIYYNNNWDTQRLIANMPELNKAPQLVDAQTFASLPGETLYRTVNAQGKDTALDICGRTMTSDVSTIGEGVMGDGFYFSNNKRASQSYGNTKGNINKSAMMQAKLNQNAKVIEIGTLDRMLSKEPSRVRNAVESMTSGGTWYSHSGMCAYALKKGYNVVKRSDGTFNLIDRNAATFLGSAEQI